MKRAAKGALLGAGTALAIAVSPATPASAATSASDTLTGAIVFAAVPHTNTRTVVSSVVLAKGVSGASAGSSSCPTCRPIRLGSAGTI
jgi:fructose-1-phosphate kinase PfkB-like protein